MTRYRSPPSHRSPYITASGYKALQAEVGDLWVRRREVVTHLAVAAAEGDRSENAEYIYRKKQLRELDRRIAYLERRLPTLKVVERPPAHQPPVVFFGATVRLLDEDEREVLYRIVGPDEIDAGKSWISVDSPVARALLKRAPEDEVRVRTPAGEITYRLLDIRYE